jgi:uncharacterized membrane protein
MSTPTRSLAKATTFRILATASCCLVIAIGTGNPALGLSMAIADGVLGSVLYYLHERAWDSISWGRAPATQEPHTDDLHIAHRASQKLKECRDTH